MTALISSAIIAYLALAVRIFEQDKTALIYELNSSTVRTLSAQVASQLEKIADKVRLLTQGHRDAAWTKAVLEAEPDLISYTLYQPTSGPEQWTPIASIRNDDFLKLYGVSAEDYERARKESPPPFEKIVAAKSWAANSTLPSGAPVLTLALAVNIEGTGQHVAVADLKMDRLLKLVGDRGIATVYVVDSEGNVVAHPDSGLVMQKASLAAVPVVAEALSAPVSLQMKPFSWGGKDWIGAYSSVGIGGLSVISQIEKDQAFRAARKLIVKSALFGLIILTAGLLISGWVAGSFTAPVRKLLEATERLSRWEFGESIHVKSNDEIAHLARAFNAMASDLQTQRAQLEANQAELERKVRERTAALEAQKTQLSEAQDALIRTTKLASLGELAGAAAHEILNPVNNMNIRVERIAKFIRDSDQGDFKLLDEIVASWRKSFDEGGWKKLEEDLRKPADGDQRTLLQEDLENLASIAAEAKKRADARVEDMAFLGTEIMRVTRIINNMRSLSRVGGERKPIDIHMPLENTAMTLADFLKKRNVALINDYGSEARAAYTVIADRDELVQVFSNLIRNSVQAVASANRRAGQVKISTQRNGDRVEVRIIDNGTGIKPEHRGKIFEANFTTKSLEEGTGLGLAITRRLVRAFGGDVELESTVEGEGTTFLVWFPAVS